MSFTRFDARIAFKTNYEEQTLMTLQLFCRLACSSTFSVGLWGRERECDPIFLSIRRESYLISPGKDFAFLICRSMKSFFGRSVSSNFWYCLLMCCCCACPSRRFVEAEIELGCPSSSAIASETFGADCWSGWVSFVKLTPLTCNQPGTGMTRPECSIQMIVNVRTEETTSQWYK